MWDPNVDLFTGSFLGWFVLVSLVMCVCAAVSWLWRALTGKSK